MESKFVVNQSKALAALVLSVALFFVSALLAFIVFADKPDFIKIGFAIFGLVSVVLSIIAFRIFSGSYFIALEGKNLVLSKSLGKTIIPLSSIEKVDLVKSKGLFKSDDSLIFEYTKDKKTMKDSFLLFYLKDGGEKIYTEIVNCLE